MNLYQVGVKWIRDLGHSTVDIAANTPEEAARIYLAYRKKKGWDLPNEVLVRIFVLPQKPGIIDGGTSCYWEMVGFVQL